MATCVNPAASYDLDTLRDMLELEELGDKVAWPRGLTSLVARGLLNSSKAKAPSRDNIQNAVCEGGGGQLKQIAMEKGINDPRFTEDHCVAAASLRNAGGTTINMNFGASLRNAGGSTSNMNFGSVGGVKDSAQWVSLSKVRVATSSSVVHPTNDLDSDDPISEFSEPGGDCCGEEAMLACGSTFDSSVPPSSPAPSPVIGNDVVCCKEEAKGICRDTFESSAPPSSSTFSPIRAKDAARCKKEEASVVCEGKFDLKDAPTKPASAPSVFLPIREKDAAPCEKEEASVVCEGKFDSKDAPTTPASAPSAFLPIRERDAAPREKEEASVVCEGKFDSKDAPTTPASALSAFSPVREKDAARCKEEASAVCGGELDSSDAPTTPASAPLRGKEAVEPGNVAIPSGAKRRRRFMIRQDSGELMSQSDELCVPADLQASLEACIHASPTPCGVEIAIGMRQAWVEWGALLFAMPQNIISVRRYYEEDRRLHADVLAALAGDLRYNLSYIQILTDISNEAFAAFDLPRPPQINLDHAIALHTSGQTAQNQLQAFEAWHSRIWEVWSRVNKAVGGLSCNHGTEVKCSTSADIRPTRRFTFSSATCAGSDLDGAAISTSADDFKPEVGEWRLSKDILECAMADKRISRFELDFYRGNLGREYVTGKQATIKERIEAKVAGEDLGARELSKWRLSRDALKSAAADRRISKFELDFYIQNLGLEVVTRNQAPIKERIEAKVVGALKGTIAPTREVHCPQQAHRPIEWPYSAEVVKQARAEKCIDSWQLKFYLDIFGKQHLSDKQTAKKGEIDSRIAACNVLFQSATVQSAHPQPGTTGSANCPAGSANCPAGSANCPAGSANCPAGDSSVLTDEHRELNALRASLRRLQEKCQVDAQEAVHNLRRAERAEEQLRATIQQPIIDAQAEPVLSRRTEYIEKRRRLERDQRLLCFHGSLCDRINHARDAGQITRHEANQMHEIRMAGNKAAHEPDGFFGTQVAPATDLGAESDDGYDGLW